LIICVSDISADIIVSTCSNGLGGGAAAARPRAVHASIDMSQTQRLPDMRELSRFATQELKDDVTKSAPGDTEAAAAAPGGRLPANETLHVRASDTKHAAPLSANGFSKSQV
jgi:hypothetical protein